MAEEKEESKLIHFYRIYSESHPELGTYIGSTERDFKERIREHKCKNNDTSSKDVMIYDDAIYEIIESKNCIKKDRLYHERYLMENTTNCINKQRPIITIDEHNEYYKLWCKKNREKIKEQKKAYYEKNKEKILERLKASYARKKQEQKED